MGEKNPPTCKEPVLPGRLAAVPNPGGLRRRSAHPFERAVADMLRHHRGSHRQSDVAAAVEGMTNGTMVSRYENAKTSLMPDRVEALLRFYGAPEKDITQALESLAQMKHSPLWVPPAGCSEAFRLLYASEATAKVIRVYHDSSIPGMLQTRAHAKELIREFTRRRHDVALQQEQHLEVEERLEFRMRRQTLLEGDNPPVYEVVMGEAALLTQRGGTLAHREQLRHLYSIAENKPHVRVRILPASCPGAGLHNAMTLLKPHDEALGKALYLENWNRGGELITDDAKIEPFQQSLEALWLMAGEKNEALEIIGRYIDRLEG
ncbi:DUF5753 domain-containing protein [Streptomyces sp. NPDC092359]|uniref:DUF5753 domain-containing protein n=1 Tax=Streptomyces sp. NPDC092359 TaxID=3366014 RepID=UPI00382BC900